MSKMTRAQIAEELEAILETSGTVIRQSINRAINMGGKRVWYSRKWEERKTVYDFETFAPISVEDATVAQDSTTVTKAGATWQTDGVQAGDKVAASYNAPWYVVESVDSETQITLETAWVGEDSTEQDLTIYRDEYALPSSIQAIRNLSVFRSLQYGQPEPVGHPPLEEFLAIPYSSGFPAVYAEITEGAEDIVRLRMRPVPDAKYRCVLGGWKHWVDLSSDQDRHGFSIEREDLFFDAALLRAQRLVTDTRPKFITERELEERISLAYANHKSSPAKSVRRATIDESPRARRWPDWSSLE